MRRRSGRAVVVLVVAAVSAAAVATPAGAQEGEPATFLLALSGSQAPPNLYVSGSATIAGGTRVRVTISPDGGATHELFFQSRR